MKMSGIFKRINSLFLPFFLLAELGVFFPLTAVADGNIILSENFEDGSLDARISVETVGTFSSNPGIKNVTSFDSAKAFGFGRSTCGASCFDSHVTSLKITLPSPAYVSAISFKDIELYGNWGSGGKIYIDGIALTPEGNPPPFASGFDSNVMDFGRNPWNDWQTDTTYRINSFPVDMVASLIELRVGDITNSSEIFIDDLVIAGDATTFHTIPFAYNCSLQQCLGRPSISWPQGATILGGVPFNIPSGEPNIWDSHDPYVTNPNPRILDIQVNEYGVSQVNTLINTHGGQQGPQAYAWLEYWGDGGAYFRKDLFGNVDIRDYNLYNWTNIINGTTTVNVFLANPGIYNSETRLDMQKSDLPHEFLTQTLTKIRLTDNGGTNFQRVFLSGLTVATLNTTLQTHFEETDPAITYSGLWNNYTCSGCSGGSLKYSSETGAKAQFSFNGTGLKWIVARAKNLGKAKVTLDGNYLGLVDLYSSTAQLQLPLQKTGLAPGAHTVILEVSGQKNVNSTGNIIDIDAFEVVP